MTSSGLAMSKARTQKRFRRPIFEGSVREGLRNSRILTKCPSSRIGGLLRGWRAVSQCLNQQGKGRAWLPVRIVEMIAHHDRRPIRKDSHKASRRHVFPHHVVGEIRQTKTG